MMCVLLLLVALATTVTCSYGQTTSANIFPEPTTQCGKRALKCWRDVDPTMEEADAVFDFAKSCRQYRLYVNCFNVVINDPLCNNETEVAGVDDAAAADRDGLCLRDGTITPCGSLVQTCMGEVIAIKNDYQQKNVTAACSLKEKISTCQDKVTTEQTCSGSIKLGVARVAGTLLEDAMLVGCDGTCGAKLANCMNNITTLMVSGDIVNMDWKAFCSGAYTAFDCVTKISSDADCNGNEQLASMLDSQQKVFGDYCVASGQPSACLQQLDLCSSDWKAVGTNVPVQGRCQADATYLECSSKVSCSKELQGVLISLRKQIDTKETNTLCPIVGSCSERLAICDALQQDVSDTTAAPVFCDLIKTALSCYDFVRSDSICNSENIAKSAFETSLSGNLDSECPDACADRLGYCSFWEGTLKLLSKATQSDQYCRLATSGNSCFNKVRTDTHCKNATIPKSTFETSLPSDVSSTCGAGEMVASVFLVSAILFLGVLRVL